MKKLMLAIVTLQLLGLVACAQTNPATTRTVSGQVLTSKEMPAVQLEFDKSFKYIGSQSFVLYNVANAEQHFFVETDRDGNLKRFFWIQFEGYLPTNTHSYNYKSPKTLNIGGLDFFADSYAWNLAGGERRPDSDGAKARAFLAAKGFKMKSTDVLGQRLVNIVDAEKRNELMIIYAEDMTGTGLTAADVSEGGSVRARWPEIAQGLLERALKNLKITKR